MTGSQQPTLELSCANNNLTQSKRPRAVSLLIPIPKFLPIDSIMAYNNRSLSPGSKRIQSATRSSDSRINDSLADQYRSERHISYASPRSSGGVIPLSTETFVNYPTTQTDRTSQQRFDSYSGRLLDPTPVRTRGGSFAEAQRAPASSTTQASSRNAPRIVQGDYTRASSPPKTTSSRDYYVTPAATKEPRKETTRKVYAVSDGTANLLADVSTPSERQNKRRDSEGLDADKHRDRGRRGYHLNGPARSSKEKSIEDEDSYSYMEPASMFKDTEPRWRDRDNRQRRNSIDRAGGGSRERPVSMLDPAFDPRRPNRDIGPPPSMRGWDKLNDGIVRSSSTRDRSREVPQSPTRAGDRYSQIDSRMPQSPTRGRPADSSAYGNIRGPYYVQPRIPLPDERKHSFGGYGDRLESREPRPQERRNSMTRVPDRSVERRGFGIREDSREWNGRFSDEIVGQENTYRDSGYAEPHRRETAPVIASYEEQRLEQEKRERLAEREWQQRDRDARDREPRGRDEDLRRFSRDDERDRRYSREDTDRHRERERERVLQPQPDPEKHHHRRNSNRDRVYDRKENGARGSGESVSHPGLSAAAGGVAAATAAYEASNYITKKDNRDREREQDQDYKHDRPRDNDRDRASPRLQELRPPQDSRSQASRSDESANHDRTRQHHRPDDDDRGLGFAFEDDYPRSTKEGDLAQPGADPDEDYRRRHEQIQRELGRASDDRTTESDPDRERRKRDREQRQRDRELRNGEPSSVGSPTVYTDTAASYAVPGAYDNNSVAESSTTVSRPPELRRRRSILDQPMVDEPAQIIDNSLSEKRENRVRIVDPPTEEEVRRPKSILKKPTEKFPDHPDNVREGVAPLKDAAKDGIPPGARWTKIARNMVNPEALEEAKERFEEREEFVIVLRVVTKEEIQKLADRTREIRNERYEQDRRERRRRDRNRERRDRDEYEDEDSENEFQPRAPMLLEAPAPPSTAAGASSSASAATEQQQQQGQYVMSGGLGRRE